jgi:hypothetical protein
MSRSVPHQICQQQYQQLPQSTNTHVQPAGTFSKHKLQPQQAGSAQAQSQSPRQCGSAAATSNHIQPAGPDTMWQRQQAAHELIRPPSDLPETVPAAATSNHTHSHPGHPLRSSTSNTPASNGTRNGTSLPAMVPGMAHPCQQRYKQLLQLATLAARTLLIAMWQPQQAAHEPIRPPSDQPAALHQTPQMETCSTCQRSAACHPAVLALACQEQLHRG